MSHAYSKLIYHCIFSTKDRKPHLTDNLRDRAYAYIAGIISKSHGHLIKAGGTADHVHLLLELKGDTFVSEGMRLIKANSSKWIHDTFPDQSHFAWQTGYGAFSVSLSTVDDVVRYLEKQEEHHRHQTFEKELVAFLLRHHISYDERYL